MRAIQASVHRGGRVRVWLQTAAGERIYATVEDGAFTEGLLDALSRAVEAELRLRAGPPGPGAIHGRPAAGGLTTPEGEQA